MRGKKREVISFPLGGGKEKTLISDEMPTGGEKKGGRKTNALVPLYSWKKGSEDRPFSIRFGQGKKKGGMPNFWT